MSRLSTISYSPSVASPAAQVRAESGPERGSGPDEMTISQMARLHGVSLRTLRFYEDRGLIKPRREGNMRFYRESDRIRMGMILRGKKLGFTLSEISDLIGRKGGNETLDLEQRLQPQQIANQLGHLERQRQEIDEAIARLRATQIRTSSDAA